MINILPNWHPILVHFTIALFVASTLFFLVSFIAKEKTRSNGLILAAYWNLWLGAAFTVLTIAAGFDAFNTVAHDDVSHAAMIDHRNWAVTTASLFWIIAVGSVWRKYKIPTLPFLVVVLLVTGLLGVTAYKGGELVYRHGLGVVSLPVIGTDDRDNDDDQVVDLPEEEGDGHDHEH